MGVWIDRSTARVVELRGPLPCFSNASAAGSEINEFYDRVVERLQGADAILVMGPDEAKRDLVGRMEGKGGLHARVLQSETASKLTDGQILARLLRFAASCPGGKEGMS
jgi:hypothetical protein